MQEMTNKECMKHFVAGMGSIFNIMPVPVKPIQLEKQDPTQYIEKAWQTTGLHLKNALSQGKAEYVR